MNFFQIMATAYAWNLGFLKVKKSTQAIESSQDSISWYDREMYLNRNELNQFSHYFSSQLPTTFTIKAKDAEVSF